MTPCVSDKKALALLVATNILYFATYVLRLNLLRVLINVGTFAIFLGGVCQMLCNKTLCNDGEDEEKHEFVKSETIAGVLQCAYASINGVCGYIRTVLLWRYPMMSVNALVVLYIVGLFARILSFPVLVFLLVWALCGWLSFREHYYDMVHPQVKPIYEVIGNAARGVYASIPKFKESQKL
ncbi:hypothetical protein BBBOND_0106330 [Babesia bigemina]|uniref:Reticulon-like protein n=1 Tax=Babesia bigemina TaxID=5866 RepID=A0A061D5Y8_BABBI|nr:hypothetical protein BBBOND_0106330 [Babesia bigemina]CDR94324.1 hypothetical protein BBBOND_0106330 [Babesia bigemina]|eukprot:XP_012766510.1 hypothetical protein BBBOND_0106330 [Babesia bigemina]